MALVLQGALLVQFAPSAVSDAFCQSRLGAGRAMTFGALPADFDVGAVLARQQF
jgi:putative acyl-CoA dehydrogenase